MVDVGLGTNAELTESVFELLVALDVTTTREELLGVTEEVGRAVPGDVGLRLGLSVGEIADDIA